MRYTELSGNTSGARSRPANRHFDTLDERLFTLHMAQHMILLMVAPSLLLLGKPIHVLLLGMPRGLARGGARTSPHPLAAGADTPVDRATSGAATLQCRSVALAPPGVVRRYPAQ